MQRVQEHTAEQQLEREQKAEIERAKLDCEKAGREREEDRGLGYGF